MAQGAQGMGYTLHVRMYIPAVALLVAIALFIGLWLLISRRSSGLPEALVSIGDTKIEVELAIDLLSKARGLGYRDALPEGRGMLFEFGKAQKHAFWMKGMRFPIDIIWLRDGRIVDITPNIDPQLGSTLGQLRAYSPKELANEVLEVPAGFSGAHNIGIGDRAVVTQKK